MHPPKGKKTIQPSFQREKRGGGKVRIRKGMSRGRGRLSQTHWPSAATTSGSWRRRLVSGRLINPGEGAQSMRKIERLWKVKDRSSERSREIEGCRGEREAARARGHSFPESPVLPSGSRHITSNPPCAVIDPRVSRRGDAQVLQVSH